MKCHTSIFDNLILGLISTGLFLLAFPVHDPSFHSSIRPNERACFILITAVWRDIHIFFLLFFSPHVWFSVKNDQCLSNYLTHASYLLVLIAISYQGLRMQSNLNAWDRVEVRHNCGWASCLNPIPSNPGF